jgi:hypothetical protein
MSATAAIHQRLAMRGLLPAKHFIDSDYVDADLLFSSQRDQAVSLEGPVRNISTSASRAGHANDMPNFRIDWVRKQIICPQGKVSVRWNQHWTAVKSPKSMCNSDGRTVVIVKFGHCVHRPKPLIVQSTSILPRNTKRSIMHVRA